jgi:hypothetical protein
MFACRVDAGGEVAIGTLRPAEGDAEVEAERIMLREGARFQIFRLHCFYFLTVAGAGGILG